MAEEYRGGGCGTTLMAFVMGAAIGGGLALLMAPRSGRETRERFRDMGDEAREKVKSIADEAEACIRAAVAEGRETMTEKKDMLKAAVEAGREAMEAERAKH